MTRLLNSGLRRQLRRGLSALAGAGLLAAAPAAPAARGGASEASVAASALSALPLAVVTVGPAALLSGGTQLSLQAVAVTAEGTVWVVQRASDGTRASLQITGEMAGQAAGGASVAVGTVISVTALGSGLLLSAAGQALAFVPNAAGAALLHHQRVSK